MVKMMSSTPSYWRRIASKSAWFKNAGFRVTLGTSAQTLIGPALERVFASPWLPCWVFTAQVPAVVQEELKQRQVVLAQLPPQEEVAAQPAVEVLDQTAGPHHPI